jgi:Calcineurin-like phosphoesterase
MADDLTHLTTFRNGVLSIFQSAVEDWHHKVADKEPTPGERPGIDNLHIATAVATAAHDMLAAIHGAPAAHGAPVALAAPAAAAAGGLGSKVQMCSDLGLQYLKALASGDQDAANKIKHNMIAFSECDPKWMEALDEHAKYFKIGGGLQNVPYVRAGTVGNKVLDMKPNARVALIADWGTGTPNAINLLKAVKQQKPDVVIHLGDVYYSGTEAECNAYFRQIVDDVFDRANTKIPVYTMPGNHDMYAAGSGFYGLIKELNAGAQQQPASFFCLRATDGSWQFEALDTGLHDNDPMKVTDVLTFLEKDEEDWHVERIKEFPGRTILLSHHQLFSAFSQIGPSDSFLNYPYNPFLLASYNRFTAAAPSRIAAWFWGHEHNLCIYEATAELKGGRCIGHGAIPVFAQNNPYEVPEGLRNPPQLVAKTQLPLDGGVYANGYVMIAFDGTTAQVDYFQGAAGKPSYTETLPLP